MRDAALALNLISQFGTPQFVGKAPPAGYAALLGRETLAGKRVGLYGPGWKDVPLSPEVQALYESAVAEIVALGATVVEDPFAGTDLDSISPNEGYDARGYESVVYDWYNYLQDFNVSSINEFERIVGLTPFDASQPIGFRTSPEQLAEPFQSIYAQSLTDPAARPDLAPFAALRARYTKTLAEVFDKYELDALVYPHATEMLPLLDSDVDIVGTTISDVNIGGFPLVTVPSTVAEGAPSPFSLLFVGQMFSEALLLALAYDYEQATRLRIMPPEL